MGIEVIALIVALVLAVIAAVHGPTSTRILAASVILLIIAVFLGSGGLG